MDRVYHHTVSSRRRLRIISRVEKLLIVARIVLLVKASRKTEIGQFDVAIFVDEDVIGFDISE